MAATALQFRKSILEGSPIESKRVRKTFYFRLASESPAESDDDTESVYSLQGKETERVKDTTDTETESEYELEIEYEVGSLSESNGFGSSNGSESEDMVSAAAAAVVCFDSNKDVFITDAEESDNSQCDDNTSSALRDFWTCIQCKRQNDNPQYRFCDKCYQDRKLTLPPRPRRHKKAKRSSDTSFSSVKINVLQSTKNQKVLSQDSGIGSSQELGFSLDKVLPSQFIERPSTSKEDIRRKRQISESSVLSEDQDVSTPKRKKKKEQKNGEKKVDIIDNEIETKEVNCEVSKPLPELKEMCIICNSTPKNSVFLHGRIAHMCCCYRCAMKTWKKLKRCPICNRIVSNVVRVFTT